jgi:hypothetical protein
MPESISCRKVLLPLIVRALRHILLRLLIWALYMDNHQSDLRFDAALVSSAHSTR